MNPKFCSKLLNGKDHLMLIDSRLLKDIFQMESKQSETTLRSFLQTLHLKHLCKDLGRGGGRVVIVVAFYYDNRSSYLGEEVNNFFS